MTTRAQQTAAKRDELDDIGVEVLELADEYIASMQAVARNLRRVLCCRDCAQLLARYVQYARDLEAESDAHPVGLAEWLRAAGVRGV